MMVRLLPLVVIIMVLVVVAMMRLAMMMVVAEPYLDGGHHLRCKL